MSAYNLNVTLRRQKDGLWRAEVPGLDGCFVDAETLERALVDIQGVAAMFIEMYAEEGRSLPAAIRQLEADGGIDARLPIITTEHPSRRPRSRAGARPAAR